MTAAIPTRSFPPRRILSIDGGGIKGTLPAAFLAALEEDLGRPIGRYFDLIAGTSTGGILAIGLALGIPAKELLRLYVQRGPTIFGQQQELKGLRKRLVAWWARGRHVAGPKHDAEILRRELSEILGGHRIGDAQTRLVIPAWEPDHRSVYLFKTPHHERIKTDYKRPALDAAMGTAAAPTYFERYKASDQTGLLDGGVWANNPIAVAVVEAITLLDWPASSLHILSLGCGEDVYMLDERPGLLNLGLDALQLYADGQSRGALGMAKLLTGHIHERTAIHRYSPSVPKGFFSLDDTSKISRLQGMGASAARNARPQIEPVFLSEPAAPFEPIYSLKELAA